MSLEPTGMPLKQRKQQGVDSNSSPTWQQHKFKLEEEPNRTNFI